MTTNLILDSRQRAMLTEMRVRVWLPEAVIKTTLVQTSPASVPVRREPPLRLPVLDVPPAQAAGLAATYVIGNMPDETASFDYILLGEPCTGDAEKLLAGIVKTLGGTVFVAQMVTAANDGITLTDQFKQLTAKCILALGPHPAKALLSEASEAMPFGKLRGTVHSNEDIPGAIIVTYHPLQLLRQPLAKAQVWLDLKLAMRGLG